MSAYREYVGGSLDLLIGKTRIGEPIAVPQWASRDAQVESLHYAGTAIQQHGKLTDRPSRLSWVTAVRSFVLVPSWKTREKRYG